MALLPIYKDEMLFDGSYIHALPFCLKNCKNDKCLAHYRNMISKTTGFYTCPYGLSTFVYNGAVAGMALVGSAILAAQKVIVDGNLMRAETEVEHLVWHEVVILVRISLRPTPEHQASPPVCASTHRRNSSLGTTMRLPIRSVGKPVSCMSS